MGMKSKSNASVNEAIDPNDETRLEVWAKKLDASVTQIREAIKAVGDNPADIELHLKGSRSTTNSERVAEQTH